MAVRVRFPPGAAPEPLPAQLLPCRVQHDGPAPVAAFLRARPGPGGELWASFRGRRLGGRELPLPPGYTGVVLRGGEPGEPPLGEPGDPQAGRVSVTGTFGAITDWGATPPPAPGRGLARALQWGPLARALHAPVTEDSDEEVEP
ncbi:LOW QUALITY PROTEIN: ribonuclease H2 subunit C [Vidua macroura]|uniref:LOW QUALITY PROTEIN: ribonuclease H2 subunit C n=1 Tax=Vidua macroura TaxID=187451 RepID=UPI0023A83FB7|nr:LOW QUALITY PROTEIN: ribonuclease H2 subunit C [Vidua macroura]